MKNQINQDIIKELRRHNILTMYWNETIEKELEDTIQLKYEPIEYNGCYKKKYIFDLNYVGTKDILKRTTARMELIFTSTVDLFNVSKAKKNSESSSEVHTINVEVNVNSNNNSILYCKFTLWSDRTENLVDSEEYDDCI